MSLSVALLAPEPAKADMINNPTEKEVRATAQMNVAVKMVEMVCTNVTVDADFAAIISTAHGKNRGLYNDTAHEAYQSEVLLYHKLLSESEATLGQDAQPRCGVPQYRVEVARILQHQIPLIDESRYSSFLTLDFNSPEDA